LVTGRDHAGPPVWLYQVFRLNLSNVELISS
jgi:hypothetical protein